MSSDAFAMLGEPRRPWPDLAALKENFTRRSAEGHPDRFRAAGGEALAGAERAFAALNTAYQTLKDPRARLLHLIELEFGSRPADIQRIPPGTMDLFVEVGQVCRDADEHLQKRAAAGSALQRAVLAGEGIAITERLQEMGARVESFRAGLEEAGRDADRAWAEGNRDREGLEQLYRRFSYAARWGEQLRERLLALM